MKRQQDRISSLSWVYISGAASIFFLILAAMMILYSPWLSAYGFTKTAFYIVLIPVGMASAAFLFGAMRSHAKYVGKGSYGSLELTGPVVIFCLVIVGGFYLASPESSFLLTIRAVDANDQQKIINSGSMTIDIGDQRLEKEINSNGEILIAGISSRFSGQEIKIIPHIKSYKVTEGISYPIPENKIIYMKLEKVVDSTKVRGMVIDKSGNPIDSVLIDVESGIASSISDMNGKFSFIYPGSKGDEVLLTAIKNGRTGYRQYITLTEGSIVIPFTNEL